MLEYAKLILQSVSFDAALFEKELYKLLKWIFPQDVAALESWCYEKFSRQHAAILDECFRKISLEA